MGGLRPRLIPIYRYQLYVVPLYKTGAGIPPFTVNRSLLTVLLNQDILFKVLAAFRAMDLLYAGAFFQP